MNYLPEQTLQADMSLSSFQWDFSITHIFYLDILLSNNIPPYPFTLVKSLSAAAHHDTDTL